MALIHELWLNCICHHNPDAVKKYIDIFGSAENAYNAKPFDPRSIEAHGNLIKSLKNDKSFDAAERVLEECFRNDIQVMSILDDDYPALLRQIDNPPRILYIKGERFNFNNYLSISMVGTRESTQNGRRFASKLAFDLAAGGFIVISGMARGIDAAAHKGALSAGGKTFAFLAGGVDIIYPKENSDLYRQMIENGGIISEQPPGIIGRPQHYQQRNRLITGISMGTVIIEGEESSGTSMSANIALGNNRDIFAVPGSPMLRQSELPNNLIADGSKIVRSALDIIETYAPIYPELLDNGMKLIPQAEEIPKSSFQYQLDDIDKAIINYIKSSGDPRFPDEICEACNIPINVVAGKLTVLMLCGILSQEPGNKYSLTGGKSA